MKIREWDWDLQAFVPREWDDDMVAEFVDWLLNTKAWRDDVELVHWRFLKLRIKAKEKRDAAAAVTAPPVPSLGSAPDVNLGGLTKPKRKHRKRVPVEKEG
jgi:hypothetical protein